MSNKKWRNVVLAGTAVTLVLTGCTGSMVSGTAHSEVTGSSQEVLEKNEISATLYENSEDGGHAIIADGETASYSNASVKKTGDSEGDETDFYGENSAIFATNKANLTLSQMDITTDGTHANAVFSYGEGTVVDISDSTINTSGNCSGGLMTTGGGTMNASNLTVNTTGNSSAAIRSDRGGGTVTVTGGTYNTSGVGSPAIYSTADITVNDAELTSSGSQGVVVEGKNSVALNNVKLDADNNEHNSDKSDYYEAVMIYQSMSGDADAGLSKFSANEGSITNANGDIFFVNNTATDISLSGVEITNNGDGVFLRAAAAGWGKEGSNGGKVNLTASAQNIDGDMVVDEVSTLNLYLNEGSTFNGAINPDGLEGKVYVELTGDSKWTLTDNSNISALTCDEDSIDLNGHTLTVNGKAYSEGTSSKGEAIEIKANEGGMDGMQAPPDGENMQGAPGENGMQGAPGGNGQPPQGKGGNPGQNGGMQPPSGGFGQNPPDGEPPAMPDGDMAPGAFSSDNSEEA